MNGVDGVQKKFENTFTVREKLEKCDEKWDFCNDTGRRILIKLKLVKRFTW